MEKSEISPMIGDEVVCGEVVGKIHWDKVRSKRLSGGLGV